MSGKEHAETGRANRRPVKKPIESKGRKQRTNDIGRALRSVYDDTLREAVPGDFADLLGKLN